MRHVGVVALGACLALAFGTACSALLGLEAPIGLDAAVVDSLSIPDATPAADGPVDASVDAPDGPPLSVPTVPVLRQPMRNAYDGSVHRPDSRRPTFIWEASMAEGASAITYELELSTDASFTSSVTKATATTTRHRPDADLPVRTLAPVGARFYWRVRACNGAACSAFSDAWWVNVGRSDRDFNGDGFADVIVGAEGNDAGGANAGRAYVYFGAAGGSFDATPDGILTGGAGDIFGSAVSLAGDVNGDGFADVLVGAFLNDAGGADAGRAYVYLGGAGGGFDPTPDGVLTGAAAGDRLGISIGSAGDVNGDGFADILVGASFNDAGGTDAGRVYVYFGAAGGSFDATSDGMFTGAAANDRFGVSVASAGDVNGDGFADVIIGAELSDAGGTNAGRAYVYLGGAGAFDDTPDGTLTGAAADDRFGISVASAGDVNGDGFSDVLVGAYLNDKGGQDAGRAYVYFGAAGAFDTTPDGTFTGVAATDRLGTTVASAGDVNGDGFADIVIGASFNDTGGIDIGRAYVYLGGAGSAFDDTPDGTLTGAATQDRFAVSVASAGDVNGDGFADVVIGAFFSDAGGIDAGRAYVYLGGAGAGFEASPDGILTGVAADDHFGLSVAANGRSSACLPIVRS